MDNLREWFKNKNFETVKEGAETLTAELGISVKEYEDEGLFVFNYSQIDSPKTHPVVIECRGLILTNDFTPVCRPFDRFFNLGEAPEVTESFDFDNTNYFEKADGSLVKVYFWNDEWHVATRGTAFAESENYTGEVFETLILKAFGCKNKTELTEKMSAMPECYTHIFEYTSPSNRIVTPYTEDKMVLLGVRHNTTGEEASRDNALQVISNMFKNSGLNVREAVSHSFESKEDMLKAVQALDGLKEGFVCYSNGKRIKVKSDVYVQVHRLRGDTVPTPKRIAELVVTNEVEEYLAYFPEDRNMFQPITDSFVEMSHEMTNVFNATNHITDQKAFALEVKNNCYSGVLFTARKNNSTPILEFFKLPINRRVKLLLTYRNL